MGEYISWLITILYDKDAVKMGMKIHKSLLTNDCIEFPLESENRKLIQSLLPLHVQSMGPIIAIEELFEIGVRDAQK